MQDFNKREYSVGVPALAGLINKNRSMMIEICKFNWQISRDIERKDLSNVAIKASTMELP